MSSTSERIRTAALIVLAVVVLAFAGWVLQRDPSPPHTTSLRSDDPSSTPSGSSSGSTPRTSGLIAILGDGYGIDTTGSTGSTGSGKAGGWVDRLPDDIERRLQVLSTAGSAYTDGGTTQAGTTFEAQAASVSSSASTVVVFGGRADVSASTADLTQAATKLYSLLRRRHPHARLLVIGPVWPANAAPRGAVGDSQTLRAAARAAGVPYFDPMRDPGWLADGDVTASGALTSSGQAALATKVASALHKAGAVD